jgi:hypothetical protein
VARPDRLFLHIGLPKTGTTAWQVWAEGNRAALLDRGIDLPDAMDQNPWANHHFLRVAIRKGDVRTVSDMLEAARAPTLFVSNEGLSLHLHEMRPDRLRQFRDVVAGVEVICVLVLRRADDWVRSMYKQMLLNTQNAAAGYGTCETLEEFAARPQTQAMVDHPALARAAQVGYGARDCVVLDYEQAPFEGFCRVLGLDGTDDLPLPPRVHTSVSDAVAELVRQANGLGLDPEVRQALLAVIQEVTQTGHVTLIRADRTVPPSLRSAAVLLPVLRALRPTDPATSALWESLHGRLIDRASGAQGAGEGDGRA